MGNKRMKNKLLFGGGGRICSEPERKRFRMEMSEQEGVAGKRDGTAVLSLIYTKRGTLFSGYDYDNTQR